MSDLYQTALKEHQVGNLDSAAKLYNEILETEPQNHDVLHLLSILFAQRQDFLLAHHFIERALVVVPGSPTLNNTMGNVLKNLKRYGEAITHYTIALQLNPNSASVHNNLGNVFYHLEKFNEAKNHYLEAIRLKPDYADAYYNLSLVLIKQDLFSEAKKNLELVLQVQSEHGQAHISLAYLFQLQGEFDQAMAHYQKGIEMGEGNILSHQNLGAILINKGRYGEAIDHFKKVLELDPKNIEALHNLGATFLLQKKLAEALPYFLQLAQMIKGPLQSAKFVIPAEAGIQKIQQVSLNKNIEKSGLQNTLNDFDVYYNLGVIYLGLENLDEAVVYFNKALDITPKDFATNVNLGIIHLQRQDFTKAESYYLQAATLQPDNEEINYILAAIQQKNIKSKAPDEYVKHLFDQYAPYFDKHLEMLGYQAPQLLFDAVKANFVNADHSLVILDLGCGTGMSGVKFQPLAKKLIGIDLSAKMLEFAKSKNIYTDLKLGTIEDVIIEFSNVDVVIASDSLVYFGDLGNIFSQSYKVLTAGGIFAFTVEVSEDTYPYVLQRSARFAHSSKYIKEIAVQNNFSILKSDRVVLRKQGDVLIGGDLFILKK